MTDTIFILLLFLRLNQLFYRLHKSSEVSDIVRICNLRLLSFLYSFASNTSDNKTKRSMMSNLVSVKKAIERGERQITHPCLIIITLLFTSSILLPVLGFSWWCLLLFPAGILLSFFYNYIATWHWSIWAYQSVNDIHQLQRSAEIAGFLKRGNYERTHPRFSEAVIFIDDSAIPQETQINKNSLFGISRKPELTLSDAGIHWHGTSFFPWDEIQNERIAKVGFTTIDIDASTSFRSSHDYFRFKSETEHYEMAISSLRIAAWELDLLLYIYRGRFEQKSKITLTEQATTSSFPVQF